MGRRGPVPMPANVRAIRGRTSHSKSPDPAVKAPPGRPSAPSWLGAEAKAEWRRVVPELDRLGVLSKIDRAVLTAYCSAWAKLVLAERALEAHGSLTHTRANDGVTAKHPVWQVYREAATLVAALAKELYLTPVARLRMTKPEDADGEGDDGILD